MRKLFFAGLFPLLFCGIAMASFGQDTTEEKMPYMLFLPLGYDFMRMEKQTAHRPAIGAGFLLGEQEQPFTEVERRFFTMALYQPFFLKEEPLPEIPKQFHQIYFIFDGRISRHQLLLIFKSASDKPIADGLHTVQTGADWGYELVRQQHLSLILDLALCVTDFSTMGILSPVLPMPLIRFSIDTQWFVSSFEFLTGPNFEFTIAPKERVRFTADMRMDYYRSIGDLICEFALWYRLFDAEHRLGDFAGIGISFKNDSVSFTMAHNAEKFELQQTAIFATIDITLIKLQAGWIFDSRYLVDGEKAASPGRGFYVSVQGIIPVVRR